MKDYIDYSKRLSPKDHYRLYIFSLLRNDADIDYWEWDITEELIDQYNDSPASVKREIGAILKSNPKLPVFLKAFEERPWEFEKPVLWSDREKTPYYIQQLKESHAFEVYIDWLFRQRGIDIGLYYGKEQQYHMGETAAGIEIKHDKRSAETGNYYIEYQERMRADAPWVNSGILKEDHTRFYLLGTMKGFVIFERKWLMSYYHRLVEKGEKLSDARLVQEKAHNTSKGFILFPEASSAGNIPLDTLIEQYLQTQI